uniref:Asp23/Gls24 family envelope stress response protein n=1 Tax=Actinokineospora iranica TaxID=1271860 RepID=UPI000B82A574|nr:Asp23/Gls24 family envelope stress response protein [Actinokineospora iranica]
MSETAEAAEAPARVLPDPEDRGTLRIDAAVVRKLAEHAADSAAGTVVTRRSLAGVDLGARGASATVTGDGDQVDLRLDLALRYPAPVRDVVARLRTRVAEEVERITSYRVRGVDVVVSALLPESRPRVQ